MKNFQTFVIAALAASSFFTIDANAGLFDDDEARRAILEIRTKVDNLQREINNRIESRAEKNSVLDLASENARLAEDVAKLRGQLEVLSNELANAQQRQKDFYTDLDNRLRKLEPQRVTVDGKEADIEPGEKKDFETALALFKSGDYKSAGALFFDFVKRYPQSGYAASAYYWLGNSYYAQRDYRNAISTQQLVVANFPDSSRAADALLNIASCYTELKDKPNAKRTLETLVNKYPTSNAAGLARERLANLK